MSKFKVGDIVVGKASASWHYCITGKGWKGRVTEIVDEREFRAKAVFGSSCPDVTFCLEFEHFDLVKSAEAKCSNRDEFDFETGAALALDRLLAREEKAEPEVPKFTKADLKDGMFCRMGDGAWFVIVGDLAVCDDGMFCRLSELDEDLSWPVAGPIEVVLEGVECFNIAKLQGSGSHHVRYVRPGVKF